MGKFGIGARVRLIEGTWGPELGSLGTVFAVERDGPKPYTRDVIFDNFENGHDGTANDGSKNHWNVDKSALEIVDAQTAPTTFSFKVGDKAKTRNGTTVTIIEVDGNPGTDYPFAHDRGNGGYHGVTVTGKSCIDDDEEDIIEALPAAPAVLPPGTKARIVRPHRNAFGAVLDYKQLAVGTIVTLGDTTDVMNSTEEGWTAYKTDKGPYWVRSDDIEVVVDEPAVEAAPVFAPGVTVKITGNSRGHGWLDDYVGKTLTIKNKDGWDGVDGWSFVNHNYWWPEVDLQIVDAVTPVEPAPEPTPQPKYKKGDRVIILHTDYADVPGMQIGCIAEVAEDGDDDGDCNLRSALDGDEVSLYFFGSEIAPAPTDFQVGDVVNWNHPGDTRWQGVTITEIKDSQSYAWPIFANGGSFRAGELTLVRRPPIAPVFPVGAKVTITGTVSGLNKDNRSVMLAAPGGTRSFDFPVSELKAA